VNPDTTPKISEAIFGDFCLGGVSMFDRPFLQPTGLSHLLQLLEDLVDGRTGSPHQQQEGKPAQQNDQDGWQEQCRSSFAHPLR
jgi:hypothetical protein